MVVGSHGSMDMFPEWSWLSTHLLPSNSRIRAAAADTAAIRPEVLLVWEERRQSFQSLRIHVWY